MTQKKARDGVRTRMRHAQSAAAMATGGSVHRCSKCSSSYVTLFELVGHIRAVHSSDMHMELTCAVSDCEDVFSSTSSWYRHIRSCHSFEYYHYQPTDQPDTSSVDSEMHQCVQPPTPDTDYPEDHSQSEDLVARDMSACDVAAGMMIKLKEECKLTQKAMSEVVNIAGFACDYIIKQAQSVVREVCQKHGLHQESSLVLDINGAVEQIHDPFANLSTTYLQHSYIARNMPYVVSNVLNM